MQSICVNTSSKFKPIISLKFFNVSYFILLSSLTKYFENDSSQAELVSKFIMENREIKIKEGIRFK